MKKKIYNVLIIISSILAGIVFTFSGFVKAIDPLGSTYKFIDYFQAFHMPWLEFTAFPLSIILSGLEFVIGVCLLLLIQKKLAGWGALLFMIFFTPLTLWLALTNPVHDCGCFGDALILTNWQTFYKNILILIFVVISFIGRNSQFTWLKPKAAWLVTIIIAVLITGFSWYNLHHLPVIDFRPYKVGTYIPDKMIIPEGAPADVYEQYFTLKDTITGKVVEIESSEYMADTNYWKSGTVWKFISSSEPRLLKKGYEPPIHDFTIRTFNDDEITNAVLSDSGYTFILVAYDLTKSKTKKQPVINALYDNVLQENHHLICLTSSLQDIVIEFKKKHQVKYDFYVTDPITLKTIIRANPGIVLLKGGTILAKWNVNDLPDYMKIKEKYMLSR